MLKISPNGQQNILECMRRIGVLPESPCNGKGLCGKCKVRIVSGKVSEPTLQEQKLLTQQELSEGVRLACLTLPLEELQIDALDLMSEQNSCALSAGEMTELNLHPAVALKFIFLEAPTLAKATCLCAPLDRPCTLEALRKLLKKHRSLHNSCYKVHLELDEKLEKALGINGCSVRQMTPEEKRECEIKKMMTLAASLSDEQKTMLIEAMNKAA